MTRKVADILSSHLKLTPGENLTIRREFTWVEANLKELNNSFPNSHGGHKLTSGSVYISAGGGLKLRSPETASLTVHLQSDGDFLLGSNVELPASTSMVVLSNDQTYNSEALGKGDLLLGDNSAGKANLLWDVSAGQLKFRGGTTTKTYIDVDGTINATDGVFSGSITATTGSIGGWDIGTYTIASGTDVVLTSFPAGGISVADGDANLDSTGMWLLADDVGSVQTKTMRFMYDKPTMQTFAQLLTYYSAVAGSYFQIATWEVNSNPVDMVLSAQGDVRIEGDWAGPPYTDFTARQFATYTFQDAATFTIEDATTINISGDLLINSDGADIWMGAGSDIRIGRYNATTFGIYDHTRVVGEVLSVGDGSSYGFKTGASGDVHLYRSAADVWYTPDSFWAAGYILSGAKVYSQGDGSGYGFVGGASNDVELYRGGSNVWQTPDSLTVDGVLRVGTTSFFGSAGDVINDRYFVSEIDGNNGGFKAGATGDVHWFRRSANTWETPDAVYIGGTVYFNSGTDYLSNDTDKIRFTSQYGYATFGAQNANWFHINTDRPAVYMYKPLTIGAGGLYVGSSVVATTDDIGYDGNLYSVKNATNHDVFAYNPFSSFLTSGTWSGNSYSTAAKALINMDSTFGATVGFAGVKAYALQVYVRDSGSDSTSARGVALWHDNTADVGVFVMCNGLLNDAISRQFVIVPANANGDIYIQKYASGSGTLDIWIQVHGMFL